MIALYSFLVVVIFSVIVVRVGAIALELTGVSPQVAIFQAQSAFSGVGFTTSESEIIVSHPLRRRILRTLMLLGSAGLTSSIATLILAFTGQSGATAGIRAIVLAAGLIIIFIFVRSKWVYRGMKRLIVRALDKWAPRLRLHDYEAILGLDKGYTISQIRVREDSWMSGRKLEELKLNLEGITILAIRRRENEKERFMGVVHGKTMIKPGDVLICYGRECVEEALAQRKKGKEGNNQHEKEVQQEQKLEQIRKMQGGFD
ncbi:potassium transporter TrkA [Candidatus Aerophobetes bacterium]|uniref:Potassium transporter TrkA n=1 Tax=Aerophobetes bacterium TaxID=2030807 RepID=A0A662D7M5_UNCAE|nr:MAG: potassium transporter TrkA [Candidatus Aerophobetes bacterium]